MKFVILILSILISDFSCVQQQELAANATDKQRLIYDVIHRSLKEKDMPAYRDLKGRKVVYVQNCYINFINGSAMDEKPLIDETDIPKSVAGFPVKLISEKALKEYANETGKDEFMLTLGNIKIEGDMASIAVDGWYRMPDSAKGTKMSGGGGIMKYLRKNGVWVYERFTTFWIS
jgi:hypothetical protein